MLSLGFEQNNSYLTNMQKEGNPIVLQEVFLSLFLHLYYLQYLTQLDINNSVFKC